MKFICDKAQLITAISTAGLTVAQRSTIPALEGICLTAGMKLSLTGYNLETGITVEVPAEITEPGSCVMPTPLFGEIIRKLPDSDVSISVDENNKVSIRSGISFFQIMASSAEEYPDLPEVETTEPVSLPQKALRAMISGAGFCVSTNQARPVLTGCAFELEGDTLTAVSVDGYRLALRREKVDNPLNRTMKFVMPSTGMREVERIMKDTDEPVSFTLGSKHILYEIDQVRVICRLLDGEFLDWRRVIPQNQPIHLTANVRQLNSCIERMSLITSEKIKNPVRCRFSLNEADFQTSAAMGMAHDVCRLAGEYHSAFSGQRETLALEYRTVSSVSDPCGSLEDICRQLREHQQSHAAAELASCQCLSGPHRDDFDALLSGCSLKSFGSQGQTRTAAISLKLAERELFRRDTGEEPVLLLDDVLSELDAGRQDFVLNELKSGQVFITCCETDRLTSLGQVFLVQQGTVAPME